MKKKIIRIISVVLFAVMLISVLPPQMVSATESGDLAEEMFGAENEYSQNIGDASSDENQTDSEHEDTNQNSQADKFTEEGNDVSEEEDAENITDSGNSTDEEDAENITDSGNSTDEEDAENITDNGNGIVEEDGQDYADENDKTESDSVADDKSDIETEQNDLAEVDKINFVYIESPYLETPGTQRIVFAFENEINAANELTLTVQDEVGNKEEWPLAKQKDGICLFEKEYNDEVYSGVYRAISLNFITSGDKNILDLSDMNVKAEFGVNEQYDGYEDLQPISSDQVDDQGDVEASVVTIDENGVAEAQNSIAEALDVVSAETTVNTYSRAATANAATARSGNIIVALDPGHDNLDAGAQGFGLKEEVLTLKIANYCKEELEQYAGVEVYMTRTGATCPYNKSGASCIQDRVNAAADAGAQIFVSFHLNSSTSSSAKGAEVIVQNKNWRPGVAEEGEKLADAILDELVKVGLTKRATPIYSKSSESGNKYQDGTLSDYFAVQRYSKMRNIPGIIVEHAFISNSSEVNSFLKTEAGLKKLGVADATGIAKYLGLSKMGNRQEITEGTYVLESALQSGKVATVSGGSMDSQTAVVLDDNKNLSSQRFEVTSAGNGYYYLTAEHSGKVIDVKNGSSTPGTVLQQYTSNNSNAQKWCFYDAGNGYYYIQSALGTYMDVKSANVNNGTPLDGWSYNGTAAQKWRLVKSNYQPVKDGTYSIASSADSNYVLDVASESVLNKANIQLYKSNNTSAQRFEITYVEDGYYKIIAEHSGKALDVTNGSSASGANLQQYSWKNVKAQLWKFVDAGNGNYYIRSKCGTVIDFSSVISGNNIYMSNLQATSHQKWVLKESNYKPVSDGVYVISSSKSDDYVLSESAGNIQLESFDNVDRQKFKVTYVGGGYYSILLCSDNKALDVTNGSASNKANLRSWNSNGTKAQLWKFVPTTEGLYYIKSKLGTTIDLTSGIVKTGTNIQMYTMADTQAQKWKLDTTRVDMPERPLEDGTYMIQNLSNTQFVLDVQSGTVNDGGNIQLYKSNNSSSQRYELKYVADGYYRILSERSGKALDVCAGSKTAGANIQQYSWNNVDAQLWKILDAGDGNYYLKSKLGVVAGINKTSAVSGANVQTEDVDGSDTQKWNFVNAPLQPIADGSYTFRSSAASNLVLDIENGSTQEGAYLQIYTYNGTEAQEYEITYLGEYYKIVSQKSGLALSYENKGAAGKAKILQSKWVGSDNQLWKFVPSGSGDYFIKSKEGMVFDITSGNIASKTKIQTYKMNGTVAQRWVLLNYNEHEYADIPEGTYTIQSALNSNRVLDVANGSLANCANIWIYNANDTAAQRFKIAKVSDGYYKIANEKTGKVLEVADGSMIKQANVQQYSWNDTSGQLWRFIDAGDGKYYIQSKLGTVLDVENGNSASKTNVQMWNLNNSTAQKWILDDNRTKLYKIMGDTSVTKNQMVKLFETRNVQYPYKNTNVSTIDEFCQIYIEECAVEGVKAEVAFAQAMMETGFLQFGGDVQADQYNFAGLGATGNGVKGETFKDIRTGIRAHVQHLKAYASTEDLKNPCVDTRFKYVTRGCAEYVQWLGMQENPNSTESSKVGWASAQNYGYDLVNHYIIPMKKY